MKNVVTEYIHENILDGSKKSLTWLQSLFKKTLLSNLQFGDGPRNFRLVTTKGISNVAAATVFMLLSPQVKAASDMMKGLVDTSSIVTRETNKKIEEMKQQNQAIVEQYTQTLNKNFREYNQIPLDIPDAKLPIGRQYTAIHQLEKESMYIKDYDSIPTDLYEVKTMKKLLNQDNISQLVSKASDKQKFDFTIYGLTHYASLSHKQKLVFDAIVGETMIYMTKAGLFQQYVARVKKTFEGQSIKGGFTAGSNLFLLAQCTHNATVYKSFLQEHNPQTDFVLQEKKAVTAASVNLAAAQQKLDTHFKNGQQYTQLLKYMATSLTPGGHDDAVVAVEEMALESKEKILLQEYLSQLKNFTTAVQELESVTYAYTQIGLERTYAIFAALGLFDQQKQEFTPTDSYMMGLMLDYLQTSDPRAYSQLLSQSDKTRLDDFLRDNYEQLSAQKRICLRVLISYNTSKTYLTQSGKEIIVQSVSLSETVSSFKKELSPDLADQGPVRVQQIMDEEFQQYVRPKPPVSEDPTARSRQQNEHTAQLLQKYEEEKARTVLIKNPDATKDEVLSIVQFPTIEQADTAEHNGNIIIEQAHKSGEIFVIDKSSIATDEVSSQVSEQKQLVDAIMGVVRTHPNNAIMESIDMKAIPLKNVLDFSKHGQYTTEQNKHILSQAINTRNVENLEEVEQKADELVFYMSALKELVQHEGLAANHETKVLYDYIAKLEYYVSLFATDSNGKSIFRKSHMSAIKEFGNADRSALGLFVNDLARPGGAIGLGVIAGMLYAQSGGTSLIIFSLLTSAGGVTGNELAAILAKQYTDAELTSVYLELQAGHISKQQALLKLGLGLGQGAIMSYLFMGVGKYLGKRLESFVRANPNDPLSHKINFVCGKLELDPQKIMKEMAENNNFGRMFAVQFVEEVGEETAEYHLEKHMGKAIAAFFTVFICTRASFGRNYASMTVDQQHELNTVLFADMMGSQNTAKRTVFEHMLAYETSKNTDTDMKMIQAYYNAVYGEVHSTASIIDRLNQITKKRGKVWIDTQEQRETLSVELDMEHTYTYAIEVGGVIFLNTQAIQKAKADAKPGEYFALLRKIHNHEKLGHGSFAVMTQNITLEQQNELGALLRKPGDSYQLYFSLDQLNEAYARYAENLYNPDPIIRQEAFEYVKAVCNILGYDPSHPLDLLDISKHIDQRNPDVKAAAIDINKDIERKGPKDFGFTIVGKPEILQKTAEEKQFTFVLQADENADVVGLENLYAPYGGSKLKALEDGTYTFTFSTSKTLKKPKDLTEQESNALMQNSIRNIAEFLGFTDISHQYIADQVLPTEQQRQTTQTTDNIGGNNFIINREIHLRRIENVWKAYKELGFMGENITILTGVVPENSMRTGSYVGLFVPSKNLVTFTYPGNDNAYFVVHYNPEDIKMLMEQEGYQDTGEKAMLSFIASNFGKEALVHYFDATRIVESKNSRERLIVALKKDVVDVQKESENESNIPKIGKSENVSEKTDKTGMELKKEKAQYYYSLLEEEILIDGEKQSLRDAVLGGATQYRARANQYNSISKEEQVSTKLNTLLSNFVVGGERITVDGEIKKVRDFLINPTIAKLVIEHYETLNKDKKEGELPILVSNKDLVSLIKQSQQIIEEKPKNQANTYYTLLTHTITLNGEKQSLRNAVLRSEEQYNIRANQYNKSRSKEEQIPSKQNAFLASFIVSGEKIIIDGKTKKNYALLTNSTIAKLVIQYYEKLNENKKEGELPTLISNEDLVFLIKQSQQIIEENIKSQADTYYQLLDHILIINGKEKQSLRDAVFEGYYQYPKRANKYNENKSKEEQITTSLSTFLAGFIVGGEKITINGQTEFISRFLTNAIIAQLMIEHYETLNENKKEGELPILVSNEDLVSLIRKSQQILAENSKNKTKTYYKLLNYTLIVKGKQQSLQDAILGGILSYKVRADKYNENKIKEEQITTVFNAFLSSFIVGGEKVTVDKKTKLINAFLTNATIAKLVIQYYEKINENKKEGELPTLVSNEDFISLIKQSQQVIEENLKHQANTYYTLLTHTITINGKQQSLRDAILGGAAQYQTRANQYNTSRSEKAKIGTDYSSFLFSFITGKGGITVNGKTKFIVSFLTNATIAKLVIEHYEMLNENKKEGELPTLISNEDFISLIKQYQQIIEENIKSQAGAYYKLLDHTLIIEGKQKSLRDCVLAGGSQYTRRADEYNRKSKEEQITTIYSTFLTSFVSGGEKITVDKKTKLINTFLTNKTIAKLIIQYYEKLNENKKEGELPILISLEEIVDLIKQSKDITDK